MSYIKSRHYYQQTATSNKMVLSRPVMIDTLQITPLSATQLLNVLIDLYGLQDNTVLFDFLFPDFTDGKRKPNQTLLTCNSIGHATVIHSVTFDYYG